MELDDGAAGSYAAERFLDDGFYLHPLFGAGAIVTSRFFGRTALDLVWLTCNRSAVWPPPPADSDIDEIPSGTVRYVVPNAAAMTADSGCRWEVHALTARFDIGGQPRRTAGRLVQHWRED